MPIKSLAFPKALFSAKLIVPAVRPCTYLRGQCCKVCYLTNVLDERGYLPKEDSHADFTENKLLLEFVAKRYLVRQPNPETLAPEGSSSEAASTPCLESPASLSLPLFVSSNAPSSSE